MNDNEDMTVPGYGCGEGFNCRYKGVYRLRHLEESRTERERSGLTLARRRNPSMRGEGREGVKELRAEGPRNGEEPREEREHVAEIVRL